MHTHPERNMGWRGNRPRNDVGVEAAKTLKAARQRAEELAKLGPGQYVIYNAETGDEVSIMGSPKRRILSFGQIREKHSRNNLM